MTLLLIVYRRMSVDVVQLTVATELANKCNCKCNGLCKILYHIP